MTWSHVYNEGKQAERVMRWAGLLETKEHGHFSGEVTSEEGPKRGERPRKTRGKGILAEGPHPLRVKTLSESEQVCWM